MQAADALIASIGLVGVRLMSGYTCTPVNEAGRMPGLVSRSDMCRGDQAQQSMRPRQAVWKAERVERVESRRAKKVQPS